MAWCEDNDADYVVGVARKTGLPYAVVGTAREGWVGEEA